jgi:hypothetical protein
MNAFALCLSVSAVVTVDGGFLYRTRIRYVAPWELWSRQKSVATANYRRDGREYLNKKEFVMRWRSRVEDLLEYG